MGKLREGVTSCLHDDGTLTSRLNGANLNLHRPRFVRNFVHVAHISLDIFSGAEHGDVGRDGNAARLLRVGRGRHMADGIIFKWICADRTL